MIYLLYQVTSDDTALPVSSTSDDRRPRRVVGSGAARILIGALGLSSLLRPFGGG